MNWLLHQKWKLEVEWRQLRDWDLPLVVPAVRNLPFLLVPEIARYCVVGDGGGERGFWPTLCRLGGHPHGYWWFSSTSEPDMHCKFCNDDLG